MSQEEKLITVLISLDANLLSVMTKNRQRERELMANRRHVLTLLASERASQERILKLCHTGK